MKAPILAAKKGFRKISFKVSYRQKELIERCARLNSTTPNKLIKRSIKEYVSRFTDELARQDEILPNQLKLFDFEKPGQQVSIWDELAAEDEEDYNAELEED